MLVVIESAGGSLELRTLRHRLSLSKANASEVTSALERRGLVVRARNVHDRRALILTLTEPARRIVEELFPGHARRVRDAFTPLDEQEKRELARLCRKLERAAVRRSAQLDQPAVELVLDCAQAGLRSYIRRTWPRREPFLQPVVVLLRVHLAEGRGRRRAAPRSRR